MEETKLKVWTLINCIPCLLPQGFVISDWAGIDKITEPEHSNYTYSVETSINAGIDMVHYY